MRPTTPLLDTNQIAPDQSGSAEMIESSLGTTALTSTSPSLTNASPLTAIVTMWKSLVGMTARSWSSR